MNKVIFKVDDFLFDGWKSNQPVDDNWGKFWEIIMRYPEVKISLGVVGSQLEGHDPKIMKDVKDSLSTKVELFNHSYAHADTPADMADLTRNQVAINSVFGVLPTVYGAPRNDLSAFDLEATPYKVFKEDIPLNAYRELENVTTGSFIQWENFVDKYQKTHDITKVYQMHPTVWTEKDRMTFQIILDNMVKDGKEWIFASQYVG